ncbi:MAG TPA: plastocyanin/azurin family copper-binding protein [Candidatus Paceibacterota bacterium]
MQNIWIWVVILVIVLGGGYWWWSMQEPAVDNGAATEVPIVVTPAPETPTGPAATISYTDDGYAPASVTVKVGETVRFVNNSSRDMWPASARHPDHTAYDGTALSAHCAAGAVSSFDACSARKAGQTYEFTFTKAGEWAFHDHLNTSKFGKVTVTE